MPQFTVSACAVSVVLALACFHTNAKTQSTQSTETRLEALEKRLQQLELDAQAKDQLIEELERQNEAAIGIGSEVEQDLAKTEAVFDFMERSSYRFNAPENSIYLLDSNTTLQLGGQIWVDAIYTNGEMTNRAAFQPSSISFEDGVVSDDTLFSIGTSKFAFKSYTPTAYGPLKTRFEFDLYNPQGDADFHLTHVWGELGNFGAGKTFSGFTDVNSFPNVLDYWGPNSIAFAREAQVRYTLPVSERSKWIFSLERSTSDIANYVNATGEVVDDFDNKSELPDAIVGYINTFEHGYIKAAVLMRKLGYQSAAKSESVFGWGLNVSGNYELNKTNTLKYQVVGGQGIGRYINDTCCSLHANDTGGYDAGVNEDSKLEAIPMSGAFLYLEHQWNNNYSSTIGVSYLNVDNLKTQSQLALSESLYTSVNLVWNPTNQSRFGFEILYGDIESYGRDKADSTRFQLSAGFNY